MADPRPARVPRRERLLALGAAGLVLAVLGVTLPRGTYGDDVFLVWSLVSGTPFWIHVLYLPLAELLARPLAALADVDPWTSLRLFSALSLAASGLFLHLAARRAGARPPLAAGLALLVVAAPSAWFFGHFAELHAPHLAAVAVLAWLLAGLRRDGSSWRVLALPLWLYVVVGTHRSGVLLVPATLGAYALATRGRARADRRRDALAFLAGTATAAAAFVATTYVTFGTLTSPADSPITYLAWIAHQSRLRGGALGMLGYLGEEGVAPALAPALVGGLAWGALLRRRVGAALVAALAVLPYAAYFALWAFRERGAYFVPVLPVAAGVVAAAALAARRADEGTARPSRAGSVVAAATGAVVLAGAWLGPDELAARVPPLVLALLVPAAALAGALVPRVPARAWTALVLVAAPAQLVGAERGLAPYRAESPLLAWGRDATIAIGDPEAVLLTMGFHEWFLLLLLGLEWPEPYRGTSAFVNELPTRAPKSHRLDASPPRVLDEIAKRVAAGVPVHVDARAIDAAPDDPTLGPLVAAIRARYALHPVAHGTFRAFLLDTEPGSRF